MRLLLPLFALALAAPAWGRPPNVVLIVADDLGYADVGAFGARDVATPNLDRMAREGSRFTNFVVAQPVCTASRAALLSGLYPNRVGMEGALNHTSTVGLSPSVPVLPELMKAKGYATACFGKWHLGHQPPFLPTRRGFDQFAGLPYSNDNGPRHPTIRGLPALPFYEGEEVTERDPDQSQFTKRFTRLATEFIRTNRSRPYFLYLPHVMPHVPIAASERFAGKSRRGLYGDVVEELDSGVGEVLKAVRESGQDGNTLVLFLSDNGPFLSYGAHAGKATPFREGKLTTFEGGVRVPLIARWPGKVPANREVAELVAGMDLMPTLAALAGAAAPKCDGFDLSGLLTGDAGKGRDTFAYYSGRELQAVRRGPWKLHLEHDYLTVAGEPGRDGRPSEAAGAVAGIEQSGIRGIASRHGYRVEHLPQSLFHLTDDPGETSDQSAGNPAVVQELLELAEAARRDLGDGDRPGADVRPAGDTRSAVPAGYELLFDEEFGSAESLKRFAFTDAGAWRWAPGARPALELHRQSDYKPVHRSPFNVAWLEGVTAGDLILECDARPTNPPSPHRDIVLAFGRQSPSKFYYAHVAAKASENHNSVFVVNDAPRKDIGTHRNAGNDWTKGTWHTLRVERTVADGRISVYFDDLRNPVLRATDRSFGAGGVGVGSFDDTAQFARVRVWVRR